MRTESVPATPEGRTAGVRRFALGAMVLGTIGIAIAYATAFGAPVVAATGPWIMAVALPVAMVAMMTFGAVRAGRKVGALAIPFALVFALVAGGFLTALALPPDVAGDALWFGLPRRAAVIVYGVGLLPLFVLPIAYAFTFDSLTLSDADIERVRSMRDPSRSSTGPHA